MRSDRGGGSLRLWPSPPRRWRQHRAGSAGAVPGGDGEWPSEAGLAPGRRRLDGRGALAWIGCRRSRGSTGLSARTIELGGCPRGRGLRAPGAGACASPRFLPVVWSRGVRRRSGTGGRPARPGLRRERGCPRLARVALLPPGGLQAQQLSDTLFKLASGLVQAAFVDYSRLKGNAFFECLMGDSIVLEPKAVSDTRGY